MEVNKNNIIITVLSVVAISLIAALGYRYSKSGNAEQTIDHEKEKTTLAIKIQDTPTMAGKKVVPAKKIKLKKKSNLEELERYSEDEDKFYKILKETNDESKEYALAWQEALESIRSPEILDPEALTELNIYQDQKDIINEFVQKTQEYRGYHEKMMVDLKKRLSKIDNGSKIIRSAIDTNKIQGPIIDELLGKHLELADTMKELLDIMMKDHGSWTFKEDKMSFSTEELNDEYNRLGKIFVAQVMKIEEMTEKIVSAGASN